MGRLLVLLTTLLLLVMPLTEHIWNGDHFLRGGGDVEFSMLAGLLFAALVILATDRGMSQPLLTASFICCGVISRALANLRSDSTRQTALHGALSSPGKGERDALSLNRMLQPLRI